MNSFFSRANTNPFARWWWQIDRSLLLFFALLMIMGIILIGAAGSAVAVRIGVDHAHFLVRHVMFLCLAIVMMFVTALQDEKTIRRWGMIIFCLGILGCIAAQFYGADVKGAKRWLYLGPLTVQPSEFLKPSFFIVSAWLLSLKKEVSGYWGLIASIGLWVLSVGLLMIQPDLGMTFVLSAVWGIQIFLVGLPIWIILVSLPLFGVGVVAIYYAFPHVASRVDRFLDSGSGDTYQVDKSMEAFANGGWFGAGPGHGEVIRHLPDAHADFIFSVAAEEMGLIAVLAIIFIYVFVLFRSSRNIRNCKNMFIVLVVTSLASQLALQAIVHMGSSEHLLPTKGMTLPFLSYGGSSLISFGMIAGVLLALTRKDITDAMNARSYVAEPTIPKRPE